MTGPGHTVGRSAAGRTWGVVTAAIGAAALLVPHRMARLVGGPDTTPTSALVMVLGGRQLVQGTVVALRPARVLVLGATSIDVIHAASMIVAAVRRPRYRRPALISAAVAGTSAVAGILIQRPR